ncbi:MAG: MFS transporter [Coriobacteriales bacterium]|nr:MFS transporter [Coriobacteriales bacterium]
MSSNSTDVETNPSPAGAVAGPAATAAGPAGAEVKSATPSTSASGAAVTPGRMSPLRAKVCVALLVLLGFSLGCSEFVIIGIESDLADALGVSLSTTGQLISMFALPYAVMTPVLALSTGRFKRYQLLVAYCALFCVGNLVSAVAQSFGVLLVSRILIGSVSGALLAVGLTYIPELVQPRKASMVLSVVYASYSVAMVVVTSVGKIVADTLNWHVAMYGTLVLALAICATSVALLPRKGATDEPATFGEQARIFTEPAVLTAMLIFVFGVGSTYVFYGYVTPYLENILGMQTMQVSTTLMAYGAVTFVSNLLGGWIDSRFGIKALVVTFVAQGLALLGLYLAGSATVPALALVFCVALLMYLASVPCASLFMRTARRRHPKAMTLASSLEPMSFNVGISFGTAVGGAVVAGPGIQSVGLVGAMLSVVACALAALTVHLDRKTRTARA